METLKVTVRRGSERGHFDHGWLDTHHTFSFADYFDPRFMGFRNLRVINEDRVAPGQGFGTHGHRDMEIVSWVLEGAIAHQDSMGHAETLRPGEVQRMTAGTGVQHSEFNPSRDEPLHFYQLWIVPDRPGHRPGYEQKAFAPEGRLERLQLLVSPDGAQGSLQLHADARLYAAVLPAGKAVQYALPDARSAWLQVTRGKVRAGAEVLSAGDGAAITGAGNLKLEGVEQAEVLLFDLP